MGEPVTFDKTEAWKHLPINHADLKLDDEVYEGLKQEGRILSDTDLASKRRSVEIMWNMPSRNLGRARDVYRNINGRRYIVRTALDGVHIDPTKYRSVLVDRTIYWPVNPSVLERETDFVDILRNAIANSQATADMYRTPSDRRKRRRVRGY